MSLSAPLNRFADVNDQGFISHWRAISEIDLGDGYRLPLLLNFRSNMSSPSAYLGPGWQIPALEAGIEFMGPNEFMLTQPDGWRLVFRRGNATDPIWYGSSGWLAEVDGNEVRAWAKCGWRLFFRNHRIAEISTPSGRRISYEYGNSDTLRSITRDGLGIVEIERLGPDPTEVTIRNRGEAISLGASTRKGHPAGFVKTAHHSFDFERSDPHEDTAVLAIRAGKDVNTLEWDRATGLARRSAALRYRVVSAENRIRIESWIDSVPVEIWERDSGRGYELVVGADGVRTESWRFTEGPSAGRLSLVRRETPARGTVTLYEAKTDAHGLIVGEKTNNDRVVFETAIQRTNSGVRISNHDVAIVARDGMISFTDQ